MKTLTRGCVLVALAALVVGAGAVRPARAGVHIDIRIGPSRPVVVRPIVIQTIPVVVQQVPVVVQPRPMIVTTTAAYQTTSYQTSTYATTVPVYTSVQTIVIQPAPVVYTIVASPRVILTRTFPAVGYRRPLPRIARHRFRHDRHDWHHREPPRRDRRDGDRRRRR